MIRQVRIQKHADGKMSALVWWDKHQVPAQVAVSATKEAVVTAVTGELRRIDEKVAAQEGTLSHTAG